MSVVHFGQGSNGTRYSITVSCGDIESQFEESSVLEYSESKESLSVSYGTLSKTNRDLNIRSTPEEIDKFCGKGQKNAAKSLVEIKKGKKLSRSAVFPAKPGMIAPKQKLKTTKNSCTATCCIF
jgi:hypothetical protein